MLIPCLAIISTGFRPVVEAAMPYPSSIMSWTEATKDAQRAAGSALLVKIQNAADHGDKLLTIPKGDYRFDTADGNRGAHIVLKGMKNLTIDFQGSNLWFETEASGIQMNSCSNVTLKNVFLDWDPLPFIQGTVTNIAGGVFEVRLDPGYDRVLPGMKKAGGNWRGFIFDPSNRELKTGQGNFNVNFNWDSGAGGTYRVRYRGFRGAKLQDSTMKKGDLVVMLARMGRAVRVESCESCVLDGMTLYSSPFVAFVDASGTANTYRNCKVIRRPGTNRLMSGNADGINASDDATGPTIDGCQLEYIGDDFVNIHGHFSRVLEQTSPTELIATRIGNRPSIRTPVTLQFFDKKTMKLIGTRKATAATVRYQISQSRILTDLDDKARSGEAARLQDGAEAQAHKLTLDQPISITGDTVIIAEAFSSANAVIRNSSFKGNVARGIRLQSSGARIEGNSFSRIAGPGITMMGSGNFWGEGPYVHSAQVVGNTFTDTCLFDGADANQAAIVIQEEGDFRTKRLSKDIAIKNNTFTRPGGAAIVARGVDGLTITGNRVNQDNNRRVVLAEKSSSSLGSAIILESIEGLVMNDNQINSRGSFATKASISSVEVKKN